jgi:hypothetical protein
MARKHPLRQRIHDLDVVPPSCRSTEAFFFSNPKDVELMRWWDSDKRKKGDEELRHPTDARQWKKFYEQYYLEFGKDPRNVRCGLSTDRMNRFGDRTTTHSIFGLVIELALTAYGQ